MTTDELSESLEDYLETLLVLSQGQDRVGTGDVAKAMGVTAASTTRAMKELADRNLIHRKPYGAIEMTASGRAHAAEVLRKHKALTRFFTTLLGVERNRVEEIACHLEHIMPEDILVRMIAFTDYIGSCPRGRVRWTERGVEEDADDCHRCGHTADDEQYSCPALRLPRVTPPSPAVSRLHEVAPGTTTHLSAFRDRGEVHTRFAQAGFSPGDALRILAVTEGIITLVGNDGQPLALSAEEAEMVLCQ
jgi:DtxR family transcriptional regulator, Mn-dependent transcriptional regulator